MKVHEVPGKLVTEYLDDSRAMLDTWTTYGVTLPEFRQAVLVDGVAAAKAHGAVAWIVDSSKATGAFNQDIQTFIGTDIFPAFAKAGIKFFITITSEVSAVTKMTVSSYSAKVGPHGLQLVETRSVADAKAWLKVNAAKA